MKTASCKAKARKLQQHVCQKIADLLNMKWGKDEMIASREMGQSGVDVRLVGKARELFPYAVECKWQEKINIWAAIKQAKENCDEDLPDWLLFIKRNREEPYVILDMELFFTLLREGMK